LADTIDRDRSHRKPREVARRDVEDQRRERDPGAICRVDCLAYIDNVTLIVDGHVHRVLGSQGIVTYRFLDRSGRLGERQEAQARRDCQGEGETNDQRIHLSGIRLIR
jgi:hypothetical protein